MKKKLLFIVAATLLSMASVFAQYVDGGTTGPLTWQITGTEPNYTLTISGNGAMPDYNGSSYVPWYYYRSNLKTLVMENGITHIGNYAFTNCSKFTGTLTIPNSVISIGNYAFNYCSGFTGTLTIPNSVTSIGNYAFTTCIGFTGTLIIPNSVTTIGNYAFGGCSGFTGTLAIPNSVTTIGDGAFTHCIGFTGSLTIPNSVTTIGVGAFWACSGFTGSLTIPNSVTIIGDGAFQDCSGFTGTLTIPNSVTTIGVGAFQDCSNLTSITTYAQTPPVCGTGAFSGVPVNIPVNIPCLSYLNYNNAPVWSNFTNFVNESITYYNYTTKCYTPYTDNNFLSPINNPGIYYTTLPNANNCDSIICLTLLNNPLPTLCMISVNELNHNEIVWDNPGENAAFNIYREGQQSGNYDLIATVEYNGINSWTDIESDAKIRSYRYKISGVDTCGSECALSSAHKTMHLTINAGQNNSWNLIWTAYEGTEYATYNIYRTSGESIGDMELIGTMPAGNTSFSDFSAPEGYVYYVVEIMLNETCEVGKSGSSIKSNIATNNPNVGIVETGRAPSLQVYPNPTTGELRIENGENNKGINPLVIEIFDIYGRNLTPHTSYLTPHTSYLTPHTSLDISHLQSGIYFVRIQTEAGIVVKKIIKE